MFAARILIAVALFLPGVAMAADQDKRALIEEIMVLTRSDAMSGQARQQVSALIQKTLQSMDVPDGLRPATDQMAQDLVSYFNEKLQWEKLKPRIADIYMDVFTEDELRQLVDFYRSPVGQTFLAKAPQISQRRAALLQDLMADLPARLDEMAAKMRKEAEEKRRQATP